MSVFDSVETDELYLYDNKTKPNDLMMVDKNKKLVSSTINVEGLNVLRELSSTALDKVQFVKGDKGDTGARGLQGERGLQGIQGIQGVQGVQGKDGVVDYTLVNQTMDRKIQTVKDDFGTSFQNLVEVTLPNDFYLKREIDAKFEDNMTFTDEMVQFGMKKLDTKFKSDLTLSLQQFSNNEIDPIASQLATYSDKLDTNYYPKTEVYNKGEVEGRLLTIQSTGGRVDLSAYSTTSETNRNTNKLITDALIPIDAVITSLNTDNTANKSRINALNTSVTTLQGHNHDTQYAPRTHTHTEYALSGHTHTGFASSTHTHTEYALKTEIPALTNYALKTEIPALTNYALKTELPNMTNYASSTHHHDATYFKKPVTITAGIMKTDTSGNVTTDTSSYALKTEIPALTNYALKTELPNMTNYALSNHTHDTTYFKRPATITAGIMRTDVNGVVSTDTSSYALKTEIPALTNYALKTEIPALTNYALKTEIPSLTNYALKTELPNMTNYSQTAHTHDDRYFQKPTTVTEGFMKTDSAGVITTDSSRFVTWMNPSFSTVGNARLKTNQLLKLDSSGFLVSDTASHTTIGEIGNNTTINSSTTTINSSTTTINSNQININKGNGVINILGNTIINDTGVMTTSMGNDLSTTNIYGKLNIRGTSPFTSLATTLNASAITTLIPFTISVNNNETLNGLYLVSFRFVGVNSFVTQNHHIVFILNYLWTGTTTSPRISISSLASTIGSATVVTGGIQVTPTASATTTTSSIIKIV